MTPSPSRSVSAAPRLLTPDEVPESAGPPPDGGTPAASAPARRGRRVRRIGVRVLSLLALLALWQLAAAAAGNPSFVPAPRAVWDQLVLLSTTHDGVRGYGGHLLVEHLGISLRRILIGSALGVAAGLVLGVVLGAVPWIRLVAEPVVTFVRALPPLAYFSLLIIWFGIDETPKLWLLAIAALPPVAVATAAAVHGAPTGLVEAARALGASRWDAIKDVVLPAALPEIFTGVRLAVGVAYSSVVAAETVNGVPGIGGMVRDAQRYLQTDVVVLGLLAIGLSGLLIDGLLRAAETRLIPWRGRV
ncbi:UNVERIFIED_ORG: taurine transport system permease protein [Microbispora rosea subsp. rosea]